LLATISPLVAGQAQAATATPLISATQAAPAVHADPGSVPDSIGCRVSGTAADPGQLALTRALEAARAAGLSVGRQPSTGDGTSTVTYAISSGASATAAAKAPKTWWMYITYFIGCNTIAYFWYDFSANMTKDIIKAAAKGATKVSVYLNLLTAILSAVLSNGKVVAVVAIIAAILGVVGMNLKKWYKVVKKYKAGKGKTSGFAAEVSETAIDNYYVSDAARSCSTGWWTLNCGSPHRLDTQDQI
jgi:hypothetical protein